MTLELEVAVQLDEPHQTHFYHQYPPHESSCTMSVASSLMMMKADSLFHQEEHQQMMMLHTNDDESMLLQELDAVDHDVSCVSSSERDEELTFSPTKPDESRQVADGLDKLLLVTPSICSASEEESSRIGDVLANIVPKNLTLVKHDEESHCHLELQERL